MPEFAEGPAVVGGGHGIVHHREPVVGRRLKMYCSLKNTQALSLSLLLKLVFKVKVRY
jgi:hypothetical protein